MNCFDCPELGDFEGRPTPRPICCMRQTMVARRDAADETKAINEQPTINRAARRRQAREARRTRHA